MASVCGGSLSLMNAGAPLKSHVAGIAMGLITDGKRNAILSDILGAEDHLGDMDFKIAGTAEGITAIQLDLKIEGVSFELMKQALEQAREGRLHIINLMDEALPEANEISQYAPRIFTITINPEKIGALIGPGGKNIKKIIEDTECEINVDDDGIVTIAGANAGKCNDAIELVTALTFAPEVGQEFDGIGTSNGYNSIIIYINFTFRVFNDLFDVFTTWTDYCTDFFRINSNRKNPWRILRYFISLW
jgi:polyribonucleotide nucleotidyltransferase